MMPLQTKVKRAYRFGRRVYRYALRRGFNIELNQQPSPQSREHLRAFLGKLAPKPDQVVCVMGARGQAWPGGDADIRFGDFDIGSENNILDLVREEQVGAFYLNRCPPRDLVNLVNFLSAYELDIPVLIGDQFRCHSLIGYVPFMPSKSVSSSISLHHYLAKNYRIYDPLLCQGYLYEGNRLVDCHQFFVKPDQTKVFELENELDTNGVDAGMYFLEIIHPQLPTLTAECRFIGLYRDKVSNYMAGSHALPLGNWHNFGRESVTLGRTFLPNLEGTSARYMIPGMSPSPEGAAINAQTTLGRKMVFTPSKGGASIDALLQVADPKQPPSQLEFDRVDPGLPTLGSQGFQTLWLEGRGLALWHDGVTVKANRGVRKVHSIDHKSRRAGAADKRSGPPVLYEERQQTREIADTLVELYRSRAKYFLTVFPFVGHAHPDLHVVFDNEQWDSNLENFEIGFYTEQGALVESKPFKFNGSLQTVNFNALFAERLSEFSAGYWTITAEPSAQAGLEEAGGLEYPGGHMLFGFWGDGARIYDSVHSLESRNTVAFDFHQTGASDMARASGRIVVHTRKFAPFLSGDDRTSWFWVCNVGNSEEKIDARFKVRVIQPNGTEGVASYHLPSNHTRILSAPEILRDCQATCPQGTIWLESNDCNLGAMWFLQAGDGNGFATDHFTGG